MEEEDYEEKWEKEEEEEKERMKWLSEEEEGREKNCDYTYLRYKRLNLLSIIGVIFLDQ